MYCLFKRALQYPQGCLLPRSLTVHTCPQALRCCATNCLRAWHRSATWTLWRQQEQQLWSTSALYGEQGPARCDGGSLAFPCHALTDVICQIMGIQVAFAAFSNGIGCSSTFHRWCLRGSRHWWRAAGQLTQTAGQNLRRSWISWRPSARISSPQSPTRRHPAVLATAALCSK